MNINIYSIFSMYVCMHAEFHSDLESMVIAHDTSIIHGGPLHLLVSPLNWCY